MTTKTLEEREAEARERTLRLGPARVTRALNALRLCGVFGGPNYSLTADEASKIVDALRAEVDAVEARLNNVKSDRPAFTF